MVGLDPFTRCKKARTICLRGVGDSCKTSHMNTPPRQWPANVEQFCIGGLAVSGLDQKMMVTLRLLADRTGETVEYHMKDAVLEFVQRCQAEGELPTKIIRFPKYG